MDLDTGDSCFSEEVFECIEEAAVTPSVERTYWRDGSLCREVLPAVHHQPAGLTYRQRNEARPDSANQIQTTVACIASGFHNVYYHWLLDFLPQLLLAKRCRLPVESIVVPRLSFQYQWDSIAALGLSEVVLEREPSLLEGDTLTMAISRSTQGLTPSPWVIPELRRAFLSPITLDLNLNGGQIGSEPAKSFYVSRKRSANRSVLNEHRLISPPIVDGMEAICSEDYSFSDQVKLFTSAKVIIGPHGSGLANMVFSDPGALVIELAGPRCGTPCFARLAQMCGHRHVTIENPRIAYRGMLDRFMAALHDKFCKWDFEVDVGHVQKAIDFEMSSQ